MEQNMNVHDLTRNFFNFCMHSIVKNIVSDFCCDKVKDHNTS